MATYYGTSAGLNSTGTVQELANPAQNGKVKSLLCKLVVPTADIVAGDTIIFGRIPPKSIVLWANTKNDVVGNTGATLQLKDGSLTGTSHTGLIPMDADQAGAADYGGLGVTVTDGLIYGNVATANLINAGTVTVLLQHLPSEGGAVATTEGRWPPG